MRQLHITSMRLWPKKRFATMKKPSQPTNATTTATTPLTTNRLTTLIGKCYTVYLNFVALTSHTVIHSNLDHNNLYGKMVGFWHQDSCGMNLLLKTLGHNLSPYVVVTSDRRGDYITDVLSAYGATALRIPDGAGIRSFLTNLTATAKEPSTTLCIALDGPTGPYKEPKKLLFSLAEQSHKPCILVNVHYSRSLKLHKRWDHYAIPLPFSKITFELHDHGSPTKEDLRNFTSYVQQYTTKVA